MDLAPPLFCDVCCSVNVIFKRDKYRCPDCNAAVGVHPGTKTPLGRMATFDIRRLRRLAHEAFDEFWRKGLMTRDKAYDWLARELNVDRDLCHISMFTEEQLKLTITASKRYYIEYYNILLRRQDKKKQKKRKQHEREHKREFARKSSKPMPRPVS